MKFKPTPRRFRADALHRRLAVLEEAVTVKQAQLERLNRIIGECQGQGWVAGGGGVSGGVSSSEDEEDEGVEVMLDTDGDELQDEGEGEWGGEEGVVGPGGAVFGLAPLSEAQRRLVQGMVARRVEVEDEESDAESSEDDEGGRDVSDTSKIGCVPLCLPLPAVPPASHDASPFSQCLPCVCAERRGG